MHGAVMADGVELGIHGGCCAGMSMTSGDQAEQGSCVMGTRVATTGAMGYSWCSGATKWYVAEGSWASNASVR